MRASVIAGMLVALTLAAPAPTAVAAAPAPAGPAETTTGGDPYFAGQLVVRFRPSASASDRARSRRAHGATLRDGLAVPDAQLLSLEPGLSVRAAQAAFARDPAVLYAEPNFRIVPDGLPDDPRAPEQWALDRAGVVDAWRATTGSPDVVAAVIDSGVAIGHPDLQGNLWRNAAETGDGREDNGVDDDENGYVDDWRGWSFSYQGGHGDPTDYEGHGTHVAGIIGATGGNGIGMTGINQRVKIMPFSVWGRGAAGVAEAIRYAHAKGVRIANGSFGIGWSQLIEDALEASPRLLLTVSAGNQAWDVERNREQRYPCVSEQPNVVCVAATDREDRLAGFSNWGAQSVDLAAPGAGVLSLGLPPYLKLLDHFQQKLDGRWVAGGEGAAWATDTGAAEWGPSSSTQLHDSPGVPYPNDADTWLASAQGWDLRPDRGCRVYTSLYADLAAGDRYHLEVAAEGVPWTPVHTTTGPTSPSTYVSVVAGLDAVEGRRDVRVRHRLVSDATGQARGVRVHYTQVWCRAAAFRGDEYHGVDGTSFAAPHVAGTAALLVAHRPGLTTAQLRAALLDSAERIPALAGRTVTGGRLDAQRALGLPDLAPDVPGPPLDEAPAPPAGGPAAATPPRPPADRRGPRCTLSTARASRDRLRVTSRCDEAGRLALRLSSGRATIARATAATRRPGARTLTLRLPRRWAARVARTGRLRATVRLTATDAAGNRTTARRAITLRRGPAR